MAESKIAKQAEAAVSNLMQSDEDQLYEILGSRVAALRQDPSIAGSFDPPVTVQEAQQMGFLSDITDLGRRFFDKISAQAYRVVCGSDTDPDYADEHKAVMDAIGSGTTAVATALAGLLVAQLALAPAVAAVVAALIVKLFFNSAFQLMCEAWKGALPAEGSA